MEDTEHEELCQRASFSDLETDDEASWVEDGVDLRGHLQVDEDSWVQNGEESHGYSHVESDDFKDKVFCFLWIVQIKWKASIIFIMKNTPMTRSIIVTSIRPTYRLKDEAR